MLKWIPIDLGRGVFITGLDWAYPFLPKLDGVKFANSYSSQVKLVGDYHFPESKDQMRVVVANHPQGKPEEEWANQVIQAIKE